MAAPERYAARLRAALAAAADPPRAAAMQAYMRDQFPFFGVAKPRRAELQRAFFAAQGWPAPADADAVVRALWGFPERECQHAAMDVMIKLRRKLGAEALPLYEWTILTRSWWDTVDLIASKLVGPVLRDPTRRADAVARWRAHEDLWLRRTAIIFQLGYKGETDWPLLQGLCRERAHETDFFIRKAIGWALRQYSKSAPEAVETFVAATPELSGLSRREALKHIARARPG